MSDTVTLSRTEYEALLARVEDAEDAAAVAEHLARAESLGPEAARADALSVDLVERLIAGESPIRVWRRHRKFKQSELAKVTGNSVTLLNEMEAGTKRGSIETLKKFARALNVTSEDLSPSPQQIREDDDMIQMLDDQVPWIFPLRSAWRPSLREALKLVAAAAKEGDKLGPLLCIPREILIEPDQLSELSRRIGA